jgi:hypothetical protein
MQVMSGRRSLKAAAAVACVLAAALAAVAQAAIREVGGPPTAAFPAAGCPSQCSVIAHVTGYEAQVGNVHNPFVVTTSGRVVALTVELGSPDANQLKYFSHNFGGHPEVRLAILRPVPHRRSLRLIAQSEIFDVSNYLGSTPTFALATSLKVPAGSVIGLTTPTWAPAFAIKRPSTEAWRAFRKNCNNNTETAVQDTPGSTRTYNCLYRGARLLYSATFVPNPTPTKRSSTPSRGHKTTH